MIKTFYGLGTLDAPSALLAALIIGFFFGLALERAGFGSSRRLAGVFYFRDMAVLKVMFTAVITVVMGLSLCEGLGLIDPATQIYYMHTYYGAYVVAGLIFGAGFVVAGWCPGTAAVGVASGRLDALIFLVGGVIGSIGYNEFFPLIKPLATWGQSAQTHFGQAGLAFAYKSLGMSKPAFIFLFSLAAIACFWGSEVIEQRQLKIKETSPAFYPFLRSFSIGLVIVAVSLFIVPAPRVKIETASAGPKTDAPSGSGFSEKTYLAGIESGEDHVEPETLAALLYRQDPGVLAVDVRPPQEYHAFHIRGALNVQLPDLPAFVARHQEKRMIVLYSNGMTHPAQARDILFRMGYRNVFLLTDGIAGFRQYCLKPVSLRSELLPADAAARINAWRDYFEGGATPTSVVEKAFSEPPQKLPGLIDTVWLAQYGGRKETKIIDCRDQAAYNTAHIPESLSFSFESFRGVVNGVPSVLLPADILVLKLSLLNINPGDLVVIVYGEDRIRDATLIAMVFERLGHFSYGILEGGFDKWASEGRPVSNELPAGGKSNYTSVQEADRFTLGYREVLQFVNTKSAIILDVRPADYFNGKKSDEARAGHIPGAVNRDFKNDLEKHDRFVSFKSAQVLEPIYAGLIPTKNHSVVVHCRTGHQASQTFFVLKNLLQYQNVFWYDAGWTEWASRKELPIATDAG